MPHWRNGIRGSLKNFYRKVSRFKSGVGYFKNKNLIMKILMEKTYSGEYIVDAEQDISECLEQLNVDDFGFIIGNVKIVVYYEV